MKKILSIVILALIAMSCPVKADVSDMDEDEIMKKKPTFLWGAAAYFEPAIQYYDTDQLIDKLNGAVHPPGFVPHMGFGMEFFAREAFILGITGGFWSAASSGQLMDISEGGWDVGLRMGTQVIEHRGVGLAPVMTLGYARQHLELTGDFSKQPGLTDSNWPRTPDTKVKAWANAFMVDVGLRTDFYSCFPFSGKSGLMVNSGLTIGYRGAAPGNWNSKKGTLPDLPDVFSDSFYIRLHLGLGGGSYKNILHEPK